MSNHSIDRRSIRWLPKHGEPKHFIDFISQWLVKAAAFVPVYIISVVVVMSITIIFGFPFVGG